MDFTPDTIRGRLRRNQLEIVRDRIGSLKANENTLRIILGIQIAIYPVLAKYFADLVPPWSLVEVAVFLIPAGISSIFAVIAISDSIHFYTKFEEYHELWDDEIHGRAYPTSNPSEKSAESFRQALEADDVGNYVMRLAFLFIMATILLIPISVVVNYLDSQFAWIVTPALSLCLLVLFFLPIYKSYHSHASWKKALRRFLFRKRVFLTEGIVVDEQLEGWGKTHERELRKRFGTVIKIGDVDGPQKGISDEELSEYCQAEHRSLLTCDLTAYTEFLERPRRSMKITKYGLNEQSKQSIYCLHMSA
jgi:hypothetical protein